MKQPKETKSLPKGELKRELGLIAATAIVVGNIIGSGIFMAPASLAAVTNPKTAILAWTITAIGSLLIALSFGKLGAAMPKTGGPIVYTRAAFGDFAAFLIAWTYWIGAWVGNAAIITALMSYVTYFFPQTNAPNIAFFLTSAVLWIFTWINMRGVKEAGIVSIITTILKILPLLVFVIIAALNFKPEYFGTVTAPELQGIGTLPSAIAITLWAFIGIESATVPAGEINNPEKNVKYSTIIGTLFSAIIYILISVVAMGAMPQGLLAKSKAPLAEIIQAATGKSFGGSFIALGAIISTLGATSGWILTTGRSAYAASKDELFPPIFGKIHSKWNTPFAALLISGICTNALLLMNYVGTLRSAFDFMILLGTLSFLPSYAFTAAAEIVLLKKNIKPVNIWSFIKNTFMALLAFAYAVYAIYGTGAEVVMYGFILMLAGIPFYVYFIYQKETKTEVELK